MVKNLALILSILVGVYSQTSFALDTTEPFAEGFTGSELYYNYSQPGLHAVTVQGGYGKGDYVNPALYARGLKATGSPWGASFGLKNTSTFRFEEMYIDLIPSVEYSTFELGAGSLGVEWTWESASIVPIIQASMTQSFGLFSAFSVSVAPGVSIRSVDKVEFLAQLNSIFVQETAVYLGAIGANVKLTDSLELITDLSRPLTGVPTWAGTIGFIYTL